MVSFSSAFLASSSARVRLSSESRKSRSEHVCKHRCLQTTKSLNAAPERKTPPSLEVSAACTAAERHCRSNKIDGPPRLQVCNGVTPDGLSCGAM
eukprot:CAMPEP_0204427950 /NCGR_PEP_ID=MMETSP0470-20130426/56500_1 /ASSEMBLY_ACC=CAM_ASM_000385 /TAXON_ID=2969 /ORGANISM="Oxyrrhis marina" /LENGTH=94 /DNA_ID=CAMNT_0051425805 /DNA_START=295 /DNA_END=579 /DNA_ORIENTATION=+